ncbi:TolC family protein [Bacteroides sp. OttesenSCG-928-E20]|nr:TolC family protein [Bacteroides sp. OttesenSCG-928-N06]MDL2299524.1 TolC family protein [Bacteroides sp. OttesenSCG-928-E20]MDL2304809.1 TolC family protein [Bacteroides sp. OttesenSCG-928-D19]
MNKVKRLIIIALCNVVLGGGSMYAQEEYTEWNLEKCINYALENNISIRKNKIAAESSYVDILSAKADLFPNLSFSTSHNFVNRPLTEDGNAKTNSYNGNYGLNASWTVFNGGKNTKNVTQQKLSNQISELTVETSENSLIVSIAELYIQILYANESVRINESTLAVSEAQLNRAKELLNVGSIARSDYAQLEAQYSSDKYMLVNSQTALENYKLQLKQLLEIDGNQDITISIPELSEDNILTILPDKDDIYCTALSYRPEIMAGKLQIDAGELNVDIAKAGYYPTLSLSAGVGTNHTSGSDFTFAQQIKNGWNNSVGVTLSVPIFNNRQTKSAVQKAKLNYESTKLDMLNEEKALYRSIEGYWLNATSAQQQFVAAREKLYSSETSYELVNEQFNLGMKNTVELLTEKNNLLSAQQELIQAKYMAILSIELLKFYQGEEISLKTYLDEYTYE